MGNVRWSGDGCGSGAFRTHRRVFVCRFLVVPSPLVCLDLDVYAALRDCSFGALERLCICSSQLLLQECPLLKTSVNFKTPPQPHNTSICVFKYCAALLPGHTVSVDTVGFKGSEASTLITAGRTRRAPYYVDLFEQGLWCLTTHFFWNNKKEQMIQAPWIQQPLLFKIVCHSSL